MRSSYTKHKGSPKQVSHASSWAFFKRNEESEQEGSKQSQQCKLIWWKAKVGSATPFAVHRQRDAHKVWNANTTFGAFGTNYQLRLSNGRCQLIRTKDRFQKSGSQKTIG